MANNQTLNVRIKLLCESQYRNDPVFFEEIIRKQALRNYPSFHISAFAIIVKDHLKQRFNQVNALLHVKLL
jgi:hypothetical protein